jgi:hypothetical protein
MARASAPADVGLDLDGDVVQHTTNVDTCFVLWGDVDQKVS